jgi:hypothetical protein
MVWLALSLKGMNCTKLAGTGLARTAGSIFKVVDIFLDEMKSEIRGKNEKYGEIFPLFCNK